MQIDTWIKKEQESLIALRRWFHMHPEPSMKEYETAAKIEEELTRIGVAHRRIRETGVFASISGEKGSGKVLVLRADMDALSMEDLLDKSYRSVNSGCAHACGHDAHTAVLLHAVKLLQERRHEFAGEIRFFFQPGEEIGQGARTFIEEGYLDGADRIYGAHMCSSLDVGTISLTPGPINASCDYFRIVVQGKGAHVSTPQKGVDALYIASQIVINLQSHRVPCLRWILRLSESVRCMPVHSIILWQRKRCWRGQHAASHPGQEPISISGYVRSHSRQLPYTVVVLRWNSGILRHP